MGVIKYPSSSILSKSIRHRALLDDRTTRTLGWRTRQGCGTEGCGRAKGGGAWGLICGFLESRCLPWPRSLRGGAGGGVWGTAEGGGVSYFIWSLSRNVSSINPKVGHRLCVARVVFKFVVGGWALPSRLNLLRVCARTRAPPQTSSAVLYNRVIFRREPFERIINSAREKRLDPTVKE